LIHLRLRLFFSLSLLQSSDHHQKVTRAIVPSLEEPGRRPDFNPARELELRRRDAHSGIGVAIKLDRLADYPGVAAEPPAPQPVADDGDPRAVYGASSGLSSAGRKNRPRSGLAPKSSKKFAVTRLPMMRSGCSTSVRLKVSP